MKVLYYCEKCGEPVYKKIGSGRFCSRECANSRKMTDERRSNISKGLAKEIKCECQFCGKEFKTLHSKASHERFCNENPHKEINYGSIALHNSKLQRNVKVTTRDCNQNRETATLDITYSDLEKYRESHKYCEICGRSIDELNKPNSKLKYKDFAIDHDHSTNKFRGLLCNSCNIRLGWYEHNKDAIKAYLSKLE